MKSRQWVKDMKHDVHDLIDECYIIASVEFKDPEGDHEGALATIEDNIRTLTGLFEAYAEMNPECREWDPLERKVIECIDYVSDASRDLFLDYDKGMIDKQTVRLGCSGSKKSMK